MCIINDLWKRKSIKTRMLFLKWFHPIVLLYCFVKSTSHPDYRTRLARESLLSNTSAVVLNTGEFFEHIRTEYIFVFRLYQEVFWWLDIQSQQIIVIVLIWNTFEFENNQKYIHIGYDWFLSIKAVSEKYLVGQSETS